MKTVKILKPKAPYTGVIQGGLFPGRSVRIQGVVEDSPSRITVNLNAGTGADAEILLHLNPRFEQRQVLRNSYLYKQGKLEWGKEEVDGPLFPFVPGQFFEILINVEMSHFEIWINGQPYADFEHRGVVGRATHLNVQNAVLHVIQYEGEHH